MRRLCVIFGLLLTVVVEAARADPPPAPPPDPVDVLLEGLADEARLAQQTFELLHSAPDAALRYDRLPVSRGDVADRITRRLYRDPFVDAYVRWQLTSFDPPFGPFDDDAFDRVRRDAPPVLDNPWAGRRLRRMVGYLKDQDALDDVQRAEVERRLALTAEEAGHVARFRHVSTDYRRWADRALADRPARRLAWRLDTVAAYLAAGWPVPADAVDAVGAAIAELGEIDPAGVTCGRLIADVERVGGLDRELITDAALTDDGRLRAELRRSALDRTVIDGWIEGIRRACRPATP